MRFIIAAIFYLSFQQVHAQIYSSREVLVPSKLYPTIQSAVDGVPSGTTLVILPGYYEERVQVVDKVLQIRGQSEDYFNRSIIVNDRFTPYCIDISGLSSVSLENISIEGCSIGLSLSKNLRNQKPNVKLHRVRVNQSVRAIMGTAKSLSISYSGINNNEGHGAILSDVTKLNIERSSFSNNLGYGLVLKDMNSLQLERASANIRLSGVNGNKMGGIFLSKVAIPTVIQNTSANENYGANLTIRESRNVSVFESAFNGAQFDDYNGYADGVRVMSSFVEIARSSIDQNNRRGLSVYGCTDNPTEYARVDVESVSTSHNLELNWLSGLVGTCQPAAVPVFIADGGGNVCEHESENQNLCFAEYERITNFELPP